MTITAMMITRNEADRYLSRVLTQLSTIVDNITIVDDGSTDDTVQVARTFPNVLVKETGVQRFGEEWKLRTDAWEWAMQTEPDWILAIDADELFEKQFDRAYMDRLCSAPDTHLYGFHLYDMWSETHYREDQYWQAHFYASSFLVRVAALPAATWPERNHHCGRFPQEINQLDRWDTGLRVKHMGWSTGDDRVNKYLRYKRFDPEGKYGWPEQYESILDATPNLKEWVE